MSSHFTLRGLACVVQAGRMYSCVDAPNVTHAQWTCAGSPSVLITLRKDDGTGSLYLPLFAPFWPSAPNMPPRQHLLRAHSGPPCPSDVWGAARGPGGHVGASWGADLVVWGAESTDFTRFYRVLPPHEPIPRRKTHTDGVPAPPCMCCGPPHAASGGERCVLASVWPAGRGGACGGGSDSGVPGPPHTACLCGLSRSRRCMSRV
jgi:hypothetical protein